MLKVKRLFVVTQIICIWAGAAVYGAPSGIKDYSGDRGKYISIDPNNGEALMAQVEGPGCIWRIWSANPTGKIRFYLDGDKSPTYEFDFEGLFAGKVAGFPRPLIWQRKVDIGGSNPASNCYMPIPFAKSCKVTMDKPHNKLYYHIGYSTFPKDWKIKTFNLKRTPSEEATLQRVCTILKNCGRDPQPADNLEVIDETLTLGAGEKTVGIKLTGPATIHQLNMKISSKEKWAGRRVLLQIYWDGSNRPAVEAPIGDFFGDAWREDTYKSLPMGITDDLNYSYWRMPFAKSARIVITNQGTRPVELRYKIGYVKGELRPDSAYFHAGWRRDRNSSVFDYPMLECRGRGKFVGAVLYPDNIVGGWWGEGDEKIYVDGEKFPSYFGTGSEDYFGDAWGYRYFVNPYHGCPTRKEWNETRRQSAYRWHISDNIPFTKSFKIDIENYSAQRKDAIRNDYSSMAYWYQAPGGSDFFRSIAVADRIPQGPTHPHAIEAEDIIDTDKLAAGTAIVHEDDLPVELSKDKGLKVTGKAGTTVTINIPAPAEDRYTIRAVTAEELPASTYELLQDGKPVGKHVHLQKGNNRMRIRLAGKPVAGERCQAIFDYFVIEKHRKWSPAWYLIGPFDNTGGVGFDRDYGPEADGFDKTKTYTGKSGKAAWKKLKVGPGLVHSVVKYFDREEHIAFYACCEITSPAAMKTNMYVGCDDGIKIWLNGKLVHKVPGPQTYLMDQDRIGVELKKEKKGGHY